MIANARPPVCNIIIRCEGITGAGEQCKCYATNYVNGIPYCRQHTGKELRAAAKSEARKDGSINGAQREG